jgi:hypothetical protein
MFRHVLYGGTGGTKATKGYFEYWGMQVEPVIFFSRWLGV